ncbi:olfactomedin-like protein 2A [Oryzias latipes]|uniref:Olfactomedin-like 2Ba n=1 Tax=Oryzias latipes TaxID=8090 RepID=H2MQ38_ORYLA|nr:olfactomedin-like protein 2A [Oryzias latipes]
MEKLCVMAVMLCALCSRSSAAPPKLSSAEPKPPPGRSAEQNEELQGQESIISKLLGDYDKVKAVSEGSDCRCKCVVKPLSRSACRRLEEGGAAAQDFYTVETITSGPECKCACVAPPSAVNPCEGDFRLKQLREAGKQNVKLSTILELLEGSFYGMDLLKLHSVSQKLTDRMDRIEKVVSLSRTNDESRPPRTPPMPPEVQEAPPTALPHEKEVLGEVSRAAAYLDPEEKQDGKFVVENPPIVDSEKVGEMATPENRGGTEASQAVKIHPNGMIIRGMTFYKSDQGAMAADDGEPGENFFEYHEFSGDGPTSLFIEEDLLLHRAPRPRTRTGWRSLKLKAAGLVEDSKMIRPKPETSSEDPQISRNFGVTSSEDPSEPPARRNITEENPSSTSRAQQTPEGVPPPSITPPSETGTPKATPTSRPEPKEQSRGSNGGSSPFPNSAASTSAPLHLTATTFAQADPSAAQKSSTFSPDSPSTHNSPMTTSSTATPPMVKKAAAARQKYKINWEEDEEGEPDADEPQQRDPKTTARETGECKDTLATISEPVTHNSYGRAEGAWMKDPKSPGEQIYVANFYYGNSLLEFYNLEVFKQGRFTNSYKLPYNWIGTGHVVYGGAFYYNRAFSRDIIKFDLRQRHVAAWTMLHDALFEESSSPWEWRSHSDMDFAVDESGLWIIYPALDDEGFLQEVVVLSRLDPSDLSMKKETTWRTGLRRNNFGNCFVVCGVLYAVDSYNRRDANLEYAFDTHTSTQMIPRMPFINNYTYTTQIDYNPKEGLLYAWDNGHQVTYNIKLAYVDP